MSVAIRVVAVGGRTRLVPAGTFDLAHASAVVRAVEQAERDLIASGDVDLHLSALERIDGSGGVLLARLIDRLETRGLRKANRSMVVQLQWFVAYLGEDRRDQRPGAARGEQAARVLDVERLDVRARRHRACGLGVMRVVVDRADRVD